MRYLAVLVVLAATPALADCPGEVFFSCQIKARTLELCLTADAVRYSFGKTTPELTITANLSQVEYTPWDGIGRSMWQSVRFYNAGVSYDVWASIDKMGDAGDPDNVWTGGVIVAQGQVTLAELVCTTPPEPPFIDRLYDAKQSIGQCWDFDTRVWAGCT